MKLCECGCGQEVTRESNRYINGHIMRKHHPMKDPKVAKKCGDSQRGRKKGPDSEETKRKKSEARKGKNKGKIPWNKGLTKETSELLRQIGKNISKSMVGKPSPSKGIKRGPNKKRFSEKTKIRKSEVAKRNWKDPIFASKMIRSWKRKPNKLEIEFEKFLNELQPGEWKYVGDGQLIINGKCPDFVNVNGKKQIIELFGDYWHKGQNPEDRIKIFEPFGYKTLVIWEKEFKNLDDVEEKIKCFT